MWQGFQERRFSYLQKKITRRRGKAKMRVQVLGKPQRERGSSNGKQSRKQLNHTAVSTSKRTRDGRLLRSSKRPCLASYTQRALD